MSENVSVCLRCGETVDKFRGIWWSKDDDFMCPDGEERHRLSAAYCTCYWDCRDCGLTGSPHVHPGEPCPIHPGAPGDYGPTTE